MSQRLLSPDPSSGNTPAVTITPTLFASVFDQRCAQGHKGTFGSAGILGGAHGMTGAALLAGRSALKSGAGRVYVSLAQHQPDVVVDYGQPELMIRPAQEMLTSSQPVRAWGVGCGMGTTAHAIELLTELLRVRGTTATVIDADALNAIANASVKPDWTDEHIVLTPHPTEAARLLKTTTVVIQSDRIRAAKRLASQYRAWIVLKGHRTLVASPEGVLYINPTGNVALATAGTGDVLTGLITGLLAQGYDVESAVCAGVWLHGAAGEVMTHKLGGPVGVTASEVVDAIRILRNSSSLLAKEVTEYGICTQVQHES